MVPQRIFRTQFHKKLPPKWYIERDFARNDLRSVIAEVISYKISYVILYEMTSELSLSCFHTLLIRVSILHVEPPSKPIVEAQAMQYYSPL